ncbi:hypothetical protein AB1Y20_023417 [Prymnesium parvum]|uniref:Chromo domain-containing protein n=1 Tax=Prymnesium parvum TaxID=97485 RepID=A0AB34JDS0_PRYPA
MSQTYADIKGILLSLPSVKDVVISINAEYWGIDWAEQDAEKAEYEGVIAKWKTGEKTHLMIRWDGKNRNETAVLENMETDANGNDLNLKLLSYKDGRPAPVFNMQAPQALAVVPMGVAADDSADEEESPSPAPTVIVNEQQWTKVQPEGVKTDARSQARELPRLNRGGLSLDTIESLFDFLLPTKWIPRVLKYTNEKLQGHDALNAKMTHGELLRFFGYMIHR